MRTSTYEKFPFVSVPGWDGHACQGWESVAQRLRAAILPFIQRRNGTVVAIECYSGVFEKEIREALLGRLGEDQWIDSSAAFLTPDEVERLAASDLGGNDPIFGFLSRLTLQDFLDPGKVEAVRSGLRRQNGCTVIFGTGAAVIAPGADLLIYADMPRWEAQMRQRRDEISNLGVFNPSLKASLQYKRSFFIDWRACDRLKQQTLSRWDFLLDTTVPGDPRLVTGSALRAGLEYCATRPFRVVPFFDPGPWGGQWMKEVCGLDPSVPNYAWCFDCVPEENSLLLRYGKVQIEIPSVNVVFAQPKALLGEPVYGRFGPEFPIRFDFLDTMGGGNLSFQVHPLTEYIREKFGMAYTQDESYYILDAKPGAVVYLGQKKGIRPAELIADLEAAAGNKKSFDEAKFAARFAAKKHDHFLIPAGTLHCSGSESMVLEISATPYIFTFKLWDWNRLGLDGKPRPINIRHAIPNIQWDRDEDYVRRHLVNRFENLGAGKGWREERTGLHQAEFIETRRHWFTGPTPHHTGGQANGGVNVLNLVEGSAAVVTSPDGAFEPFPVHYAETFIVPAAAGAYSIRPAEESPAAELATMKAFVRTHA